MARRHLTTSALVAVGTFAGNVLSYGFSFALAHQLDQTGYGQVGALLMLFLVASIPAWAIQAVTARRVARCGETDPAALRALTGPLVRWSLLVGVAGTVLLAGLAPAVSALFPAVSAGQVAWTALALTPNALIFCYLGIAQGSSRFTAYTVLFAGFNGAKLIAGIAAGAAGADPGLIMGAMAASWFATAAVAHYTLRDLVGRPHFQRGLGYVRELGSASWSLGAVLVLSLLDGLLAAHYFGGDVLGRYQAGAMFTRAGYFGPQFAGILAYPKLALPETRRKALVSAAVLSVGIGALIVLGTAVAADPAIRVAFGAKYLDGAGSFELASAAWLFALAGATQALIQLALLDAVARRSAAIGWIVFAGIVVEAAVILTVAHHSAVELIGTAAVCGSATAAVSLTVTAFAKHRVSAPLPNQPASEYAAATS